MFGGQPSSGTLTRMPFGEPGAVNEPGCGEFALVVTYVEAWHAFGIIGPTQLGGTARTFSANAAETIGLVKKDPADQASWSDGS